MSGITKQEIMDGVVPNKKIDKPKSKYTKAQLFEIIEELEQEAEWWGEIKDDLTFQLGGMKCDRDQKVEEGDKLYEENEKLKDRVNELNKKCDDFADALTSKLQDNQKLMKHNVKLIDDNEKLIDDNEKLKDRVNELNEKCDASWDALTNPLKEEINQLKEENEKVKKAGYKLSQEMWSDLQEQLDKEKNKSFNLEHQLQMVKNSSEYNEYQELFKKKQELSQELLSLKNSKNSTSAKHLKTEKENEKLKQENLNLENEVERLSFIKKSFLDENLKHSKKELISMLKQSYDNINELHKKLIVNMKQKEWVEHIMRMISWMSHDCGDPIHPICYGNKSYPDSVEDLDVDDFNKYAEVMGFNINC